MVEQQVPKVHYDMCACVAIHWDNEITPSTNLTNRSNPSLVARFLVAVSAALHFRWSAARATARDTMQVVENGFGTRVMYEEKGERRAFLWSTEWSSLNYLDRCSLSLTLLLTQALYIFRVPVAARCFFFFSLLLFSWLEWRNVLEIESKKHFDILARKLSTLNGGCV